MKRLLHGLFVFLLGALCGAAGLFAFEHRQEFVEQWALYELGQSETSEQAQSRLAWFEVEPRRREKLALLVSSWGTGRVRFDEMLARYVGLPRSSDELRRAFAEELARRPELLPRWGHYWAWKTPLGPETEIESVTRYLETLVQAQPPRSITWREVLDTQAALTLAGSPELAVEATATDWQGSFRKWKQLQSEAPPLAVPRPDLPFSDWSGPPPERP